MSENKTNILIIDDESAIKENLVLFLEDEGFSVNSVGTAEDALSLINSGERFGVGIVDIRLPKMHGDQFILEAVKIDPQMKFIVHTGSINFELDEKLIKAGVSGENLFKKPIVDINALIIRIKNLLG